MNGWIKVHRALSGHHVASDPHSLSVWLHMLLMANHREAKRQINGRVLVVQPGQLITSRKSLAEKTGVNESKVERVLKMLQSEQLIEQHGTAKFRVISIVNWAKYQIDEQVGEQLVNSSRTAGEQQMNTPEEVSSDTKNEKNEEKTPLPASGDAKPAKAKPKCRIPEPFMLTKKMCDWSLEKAPAVNPRTETENFVDYWRGAGGAKADWEATWRTWMRKAQKDAERGAGRQAGGYKPFNKQAATEENNNRVVQEIIEREAARMAGGAPEEVLNFGEPITLEGEFVHAV